jgi:hypothetical protein
VQVINDMHSRYLDLLVEIELEDTYIAHLKPAFSKTYQQIDSLPISQQITRLSKMVPQLGMILSRARGKKI